VDGGTGVGLIGTECLSFPKVKATRIENKLLCRSHPDRKTEKHGFGEGLPHRAMAAAGYFMAFTMTDWESGRIPHGGVIFVASKKLDKSFAMAYFAFKIHILCPWIFP
jgi:hypothetical protein